MQWYLYLQDLKQPLGPPQGKGTRNGTPWMSAGYFAQPTTLVQYLVVEATTHPNLQLGPLLLAQSHPFPTSPYPKEPGRLCWNTIHPYCPCWSEAATVCGPSADLFSGCHKHGCLGHPGWHNTCTTSFMAHRIGPQTAILYRCPGS